MSVRLLTENFKSNNLFLWRQLAASGPSPNTFFLSPRCPPAQLGRPAHTRDRLWFNGTVLFVSETGGSRWWHLMESRFAEKIIGFVGKHGMGASEWPRRGRLARRLPESRPDKAESLPRPLLIGRVDGIFAYHSQKSTFKPN